ncbi:hypothetical protein [Saccharothrix lopnurensis]|uniref:Uncharacterized protein n=1 Tax=Saccharothrix lopnurensis TaxID=1670621 RepID=A0ABW1PI72_9PSEU
MSRTFPRPWVIAVAAVVASGILVGVAGYRVLGGGSVEGAAAPKSGTGELRTDLAPLVKRFPVLDSPDTARWMSGTFGRSDVPGPSTYWIDAVVTLSPDAVERLVSAYAPTEVGEVPDVVEGMRDRLPSGPFLTGDALDAAFDHERWYASAYLDPGSRELVLVATGV